MLHPNNKLCPTTTTSHNLTLACGKNSQASKLYMIANSDSQNVKFFFPEYHSILFQKTESKFKQTLHGWNTSSLKLPMLYVYSQVPDLCILFTFCVSPLLYLFPMIYLFILYFLLKNKTPITSHKSIILHSHTTYYYLYMLLLVIERLRSCRDSNDCPPCPCIRTLPVQKPT